MKPVLQMPHSGAHGQRSLLGDDESKTALSYRSRRYRKDLSPWTRTTRTKDGTGRLGNRQNRSQEAVRRNNWIITPVTAGKPEPSVQAALDLDLWPADRVAVGPLWMGRFILQYRPLRGRPIPLFAFLPFLPVFHNLMLTRKATLLRCDSALCIIGVLESISYYLPPLSSSPSIPHSLDPGTASVSHCN
ncbi:hypothetical protein CONLIGDRAFT_345416 [Coniochaeta ligniaria NRRL 30616]|uniref:Uncharacterized protein n=1 Tax=Coniochaeta ligniaria NRRL 30616 TaxID=1408157 RepID=A0A1J7JPX4_9PEZI|nr:hypothetical protein CONLIGDRAFT_345416 [Coniochaeta ligniaria NRRL 30616]